VQQIQKLCWVGFTRMGHALALRDDEEGFLLPMRLSP
jgi:hypothetical protein